MADRTVAVIAGDGIGPEVIAAAQQVLAATGVVLDYHAIPVSAARYLREGVLLTDDDLIAIRACDAVLLGAVGDPAVPPGVMEREVLLRLRFELDLGLNIRPVRLLPGTSSPAVAATPETVDMVFVRENTEGPYAGTGGRLRRGTSAEIAMQDSVNTVVAVDRAVGYAFELASTRRGKVTWIHKTNVLLHAGGLWSDVVAGHSAQHPNVAVEYQHADAACIHLLQRPGDYDVVVTDNLFGDILTDLAGAIGGGVGLMPSANITPGSASPGLFEPIHGSAPDIAGKGIANPLGAVLSAAMMLRELGFGGQATAVEQAVVRVAAAGAAAGRTADTVSALIAELEPARAR